MRTQSIFSWALAVTFAVGAACAPEESRHPGKPDVGQEPVDTPAESTGQQLQPTGVRERCETSRLGPALLRRLTRSELQATVEDIFPEIAADWRGVRLSADPGSELGFGNDSAALLVGFQAASDLLKTAEDVAQLVTAEGTLAVVLPCAGAGDEACAQEFIDQYGLRLFRRPLAETERTEYLDLFRSVAEASDFRLGIKWTLVALLQSPRAIYRSEIGVAEDGARQLTEHEIAGELAYAFGGSTPDEELLGLAAAGQLSDPEVRKAQAQRLLRSPRGLEVVSEFFRAWLGYGSIVYAQRDEVPNFGTEIAPHMLEETRQFVEQVIFENGGDLRELLGAPYTKLSRELSEYYGFGGVTDGEWHQVERPWGAGVLGQGSVLVSTAHENATSPTLRGLLVFKRLLCNDKVLPPPIVPTLSESDGEWNTTRELFEVAHLTKGSGCDSCHRLFDPPGFTFEHFDETGRFRADERGFAIDPSGNIPLADGSVLELTGFEDLVSKVDEVPQISDCISGLMAAYMFSGGGGQICLAEEQRTALASGEIGIEEYLIQLTDAPHFTWRY